MKKYMQIKLMKSRKGFSINFSKFGLMFALLSKPKFRILKNEIDDQKGYFIAIHRIMLGIGFKII